MIKAVKFASAVAGSVVCCVVASCLCRLVDTGDGIMVKMGDKGAYSHLLQRLSGLAERQCKQPHWVLTCLDTSPPHLLFSFSIIYSFCINNLFVLS